MLVKLANVELEDHLAKEYQEGLTEAHSISCPWRAHPCDAAIYKFYIFPNPVIVEEFQSRAMTLLKLGEELPMIDIKVTDEFMQTMKNVLPLESNEFDPSVIVSATCLSLFGWEYGSIEDSSKVKCKMCFRLCELSYFRSIAKHRKQPPKMEVGEQTAQKDGDEQIGENIGDGKNLSENSGDHMEVPMLQESVNLTNNDVKSDAHGNEVGDINDDIQPSHENAKSTTDNEKIGDRASENVIEEDDSSEKSNVHEKISISQEDVEMGEQIVKAKDDQANEGVDSEAERLNDREKIGHPQENVDEDQEMSEKNAETKNDEGHDEKFGYDDDSPVEIGDLIFDVESQHRWYCSWITGDGRSIENKTAEEFTRRKPGWYVTLEGIVRHIISTNSEDSRHVRESENQMNDFCDILSPRRSRFH